jgi:spermidine synthase
VDLYDEEAAAPVLDSQGFYAACRDVLERDGGVMSVNLFGRHASFRDSIDRIAAAFGADQVWSLRPTREGNTVVVAGRGVVVPNRATLIARAALIEQRFGNLGLPARKWLRMVRPYQAQDSSFV